jgi:hypothetical protein
MKTYPQHIASCPVIKGRRVEGCRWFRVWIACGLLLVVVLLVSTISTHVEPSKQLIVDHLRSDLHSQAAMIEEQAQRNSVQTRGQLSTILQWAMERSSGRIGWIMIRNHGGEVLSAIGPPAAPVFSTQDIRSHIQSRQPIFKTIGATNGPMVVEVLPLMLPVGLLRPRTENSGGALGRPVTTIEIAEFWGDAGTTLWSLKRHLMINSSAALMLLISLAVIAFRLRSYVAGRQLEREVEIARSVQRDLLPSSHCELENFDVAANYEPVSRVGGDFYDAFTVRGERAAFVLGDVSGKGVPAALLTGVLHGAVRSSGWAESPLDHREATRQINRLLCERAATERFATMFWAYFDSRSQHLINAGHCPPLLVNPSQRNTTLRLASGGPLLGLLADAEFQQGSVRLERGDVLVLYSDGIVETRNVADEEFGEDRVLAIVRAHNKETAEDIRNHILAAVDSFSGVRDPQDDRTLVVIVYLGGERGAASRESQADFETELATCAV